jgi:RNA polymerase sigma-70 factor, ECF subfamily
LHSPNTPETGTLPQLTPSSAGHKRLLSLAYGYLGSLVESEDVVQEALLRLQLADPASIQNTEAWLTTVVTRLSIDHLRSAVHRREVYPGEWLPEPVFNAPTPEQDAITQSRLSVGLLFLLEKLAPEQRVVFVLREVFEYSYESIAEITGKSESACRQLMLRARAALERARPAAPVSTAVAEPVLDRFVDALARGDEKALLGILAPDAVFVSDGGGKVRSTLRPIFTADRIVRFFQGIQRKNNYGLVFQPGIVNSGPGMLTFRDGQLASVASLAIAGGRVTAIYSVTNPDKIQVR